MTDTVGNGKSDQLSRGSLANRQDTHSLEVLPGIHTIATKWKKSSHHSVFVIKAREIIRSANGV